MKTKEERLLWRRVNLALEELESSIYIGASVQDAYLELDTIASALRELFPDILPPDEEAPPDRVLAELVALGLDKAAPNHARRLAELSSLKWYDSGSKEEEELLEQADTVRSSLWDILSEFIMTKRHKGEQLPLPSSDDESPHTRR